MEALLSSIRLESITDPWLRCALHGTMQTFVAFTLVMTRLTGMSLAGPVFGHPSIPIHVRALMVAAISLIVAPALSMAGSGPPLPRTLLDYAWLGLVELALGLALGLGVAIVLSALQMAGNLLDQQLGLALGEVFNPELGTSVGVSAQMMHQLGLVVFLVVGGHLLLISVLLETFRTLPVGYATLSPSVIDLLSGLVGQSLLLTVQVSAPVLAAGAVVGVAVGFIGRTVPQLDALTVGIPVRVVLGLTLLGLSLGGIVELVERMLPETVLQLRNVLAG